MGNWFAKLIKHRRYPDPLGGDGDNDLLPFTLENYSDLISPDRLHVVRQFRDHVDGLLQMLQIALRATSIVLYWPGPKSEQLTPYTSFTNSPDFAAHTIPAATGILGVLKNQDKVSLAPCPSEFPAIPYYKQNPAECSFLAKKITRVDGEQCRHGNYGVLCIDRMDVKPWSQSDAILVDKTIERVTNVLFLSRDLLFTDVERQTLQLVFNGLQTLNSTLDLDSVYRAAAKAVGQIVDADYFAVSLIEGDNHKLCYVSGDGRFEDHLNTLYPLADSLIGQVVKYRRAMPEKSSRSTAPIINGINLFNDCSSLLVIPLCQEDGPVTGVMVVARRATKNFSHSCREMIAVIASQVAIKIELAHSHNKIQQMTITDPLTGIANRRAFQRGFAAMYERACRRPGSFCLIICDIDLFKRINDTYGHSFGDIVIQRVASVLSEIVRTGDLAARIGGEEFAVLLEDTGLKGAFDVAERLRKKVENLGLFFEGTAAPVTISLGVAAFPQDSDNQELLFSYADQALYHAKETGRNRSVRWSEID